MRHTYDAGVVAEKKAGGTDEEAEEVGSEGAEPCAWKLGHASLDRETYVYSRTVCSMYLSSRIAGAVI